MNQRYVPLDVDAARGRRDARRRRPTPNVAPPGYYMLFLLNDKGVPSVAKFVRLGFTSDPAAPLPALPVVNPACIGARAAVTGARSDRRASGGPASGSG